MSNNNNNNNNNNILNSPKSMRRQRHVSFAVSKVGINPDDISFSKHVRHQFQLVNSQIEVGLYSLKRVAFYLKKVCNAEMVCANSIIEAAEHERTKDSKIHHDMMFRHVKAAARIQTITAARAEAMKKHSEQVAKYVVTPMEEFFHVQENERKIIVNDEKKISSKVRQTRNDMNKQAANALKVWKELVNTQQELDDERSKDTTKEKAITKLEKKVKKVQEKAHKEFDKTEKMRSNAMNVVKAYYEEELPELLSRMQRLEFNRLETLSKYMRIYEKSQDELEVPVAMLKTFAHSVDCLNTEESLKTCVDQWVSVHGEPPQPSGLNCLLPCDSKELENDSDKWKDVLDDWESKRTTLSYQSIIRNDKKKNDTHDKTLEPLSPSNNMKSISEVDRTSLSSIPPPPPSDNNNNESKRKDSYSDIAPSRVAPPPPPSNNLLEIVEESKQLWYRAIKDYVHHEHLQVQVGDVVRVISKNGDEWLGEVWLGNLDEDGDDDDEEVQVIPDTNEPSRIALVKKSLIVTVEPEALEEIIDENELNRLNNDFYNRAVSDVKVLRVKKDFEYEPTGNDDDNFQAETITLKRGDIVKVKSNYNNAGNWWYGEVNNQTGYFPRDHCEELNISTGSISQQQPNKNEEEPVLLSSSNLLEDNNNNNDNLSSSSDIISKDNSNKANNTTQKSLADALADAIRAKVSKKKRRYREDGFDLDLSYITNQLIAMGFPAEGVEGTYRNNMIDVQRFFELKHPSHYKIYNLCSERQYDPFKFDGNVSRYPFDDHNPCPFDQILPFCTGAQRYLEASPENVVAIHCKAGKGRTGFLISCFLMFTKQAGSAAEALKIFGERRTYDGKGVTIPSQIRYVNYFERFLRQEPPVPASQPLFLTSMTLNTIPKVVKSAAVDVWFTIKCTTYNEDKYSSKGKVPPARFEADAFNPLAVVEFKTRNINSIPILDNDVKVEFFHSTTFGKVKMFQFWFNTRFLSPNSDEPNKFSLSLPKTQLDKACKDKKDKLFDSQMSLHLVLEKQS